MFSFISEIEKFGSKGEKSGWTYIAIPSAIAHIILANTKKSFRIKGWINQLAISQTAIIPIGNGDFILPINASMRKSLKKNKGDKVNVQVEHDDSEIKRNSDLMDCLAEETEILHRFNALTKSHQMYFSKFVDTAKTDITKANRIAAIIHAMQKGWNYSEMIRAMKK